MIYIVGAGFSTLIVYDYFKIVLGPPKFNKIIVFSVYGLLFLFLSITSITAKSSMIVLYTISMLAIAFLYKSDIRVRIISCIILLAFQGLAETVTAVLTSLFTSKAVEYLINNLFFYIQGELISKLLIFVVVKAFSYYRYSSNLKMSPYLFIPLLAFPISTVFILYAMSGYIKVFTDTKPSILLLFSSIMLIISNILLFYLFEMQLRQEEEKHQSQLVQQQLKYQAEYFHELANKHRVSNKTLHDLKNQLFAVSILLSDTDAEKIKKAKGKIDELCSNIFCGQAVSQTGNDALDALINSKYQVMTENHIGFTQNVFINSINQIDDIDLCIVIGNALDNAIEACIKIPADSPRNITLKIVQVGDYISIEMKNTMANMTANGKKLPLLIENGKIITSKSEKALHGFGLQSIEEISNKYGGFMNFNTNSDSFILKIYMHNRILNPVLQK